MEAAPLTAAHALARDVNHDAPSSALAAAEKHKAVALEFTKAAEGVEDAEALRVLNLLEQHHQRLAQIISSGFERPSANDSGRENNNVEQNSHVRSSDAMLKSSATKSMSHVTGSGAQPLASTAPARRHPREMSSSIASNLATARGIPTSQHRNPGQPSPTNMKNDRKDSSIYATRTTASTDSSKSRTGLRENQTSRGPASVSKAMVISPADKRDLSRDEIKSPSERQNDDPFQKFYATFEGLLTKLSAPLAFAGLPLLPEESTYELKPNSASNLTKLASNSELTNTSPEISKIFSKAALRAVKEENGGPGVQESFLVVPTGGGTVSYAGILSRAERQSRHQDTSLEHGEETIEHFVDAKELPDMRSPILAQRTAAATVGPLKKTAEELRVENESLKQLTDNLSRRLYMWEKNAQSQSMALQQSIRNLQPPSRIPSEAGGDDRSNAEHDERMKELEEQFMAAQRELERYGRENEKLRTVVMRYRERWEKLKEGARVRREGAEKGTETPVSES